MVGVLTGGDHVEHARFDLLPSGVGCAASDGPVIVVTDAATAHASASTTHSDVRWAIDELGGGEAARVSGLDAGPGVLHYLVVADLGRRAARPVERPLEHFRCRIRVHLAHDFRVLVPGHAVRQLLVLFAHGFVCERITALGAHITFSNNIVPQNVHRGFLQIY